MARALLWPFVILGLVATGAVAQAKPKVAVLGLEALQGKTAIDTQTTVVAHDITEALRARAKSGTGTLTLAPGADKELLDEKITHACDDESVDCMTAIGKALGADFLMYGNIEKIDDKDATKRGYRVNLKMLNVVKKGGAAQNVSDFIPLANANDDNIKTWSKRAYSKLTGQDTTGTLIVRANVDRGTVLIDGVPKTTLTSGMATIPLEEGSYRKLAIEAEGYKLWEADETITIRPGETVNRAAELEKKKTVNDDLTHETGGTISRPSSRSGLKIVTGATLAVGLVAGVAAIYTWQVNTKAYINNGVAVYSASGSAIQGDDLAGNCGSESPGITADKYAMMPDVDVKKALDKFSESCRGYKRSLWLVPAASIVAAVGIGSLAYLLFTKPGMERSASRGQPRKTIAIAPVFTPTTSGAVLRIDW
jgi:peptidoglycan-synthase activator LpoB/PEGA domain-containing protein